MSNFKKPPLPLEDIIEFCTNLLPLLVNGINDRMSYLEVKPSDRKLFGKEETEKRFSSSFRQVVEMATSNYCSSQTTIESGKRQQNPFLRDIIDEFTFYFFKIVSLSNKSFVKVGKKRNGSPEHGIVKDPYIQHIFLACFAFMMFRRYFVDRLELFRAIVLAILMHDNVEDLSKSDKLKYFFWTFGRVEMTAGKLVRLAVRAMSIPDEVKQKFEKGSDRQYFFNKQVQRDQIETLLKSNEIAGFIALWVSWANTFANLFDDYRKSKIDKSFIKNSARLVCHYENQIKFFKKHNLELMAVSLIEYFLKLLNNRLNEIHISYSLNKNVPDDLLNDTLNLDNLGGSSMYSDTSSKSFANVDKGLE